MDTTEMDSLLYYTPVPFRLFGCDNVLFVCPKGSVPPCGTAPLERADAVRYRLFPHETDEEFGYDEYHCHYKRAADDNAGEPPAKRSLHVARPEVFILAPDRVKPHRSPPREPRRRYIRRDGIYVDCICDNTSPIRFLCFMCRDSFQANPRTTSCAVHPRKGDVNPDRFSPACDPPYDRHRDKDYRHFGRLYYFVNHLRMFHPHPSAK
jgi:hypothetical protein